MPGPNLTRTTLLREMLNNEYSDGLSIKQAATLLRTRRRSIECCFEKMPDVYVDRWDYPKPTGAPFQIFCAVKVPEDCPRPDKKL